jgi:GTPase
MIGMVAIVGRPNVGKSTLFNRIVGRRNAIVEPTPGVTRDRHIEMVTRYVTPFYLVDTGGFEPEDGRPLATAMREQSLLAIEEADVIICLFDGKEEPTAADYELSESLRQSNKPVIWAVNKIDGQKHEPLAYAFYELGIEDLQLISSEHGLGTTSLVDDVQRLLPADEDEQEPDDDEQPPIKIAVVGRPNVGKSTLINSLLGDQRLITSPIPGTTRDTIDLPFTYEGRKFILVDTAGIRRKSKVSLRLEKYTVIRALKAVERADVALLLIDATTGPVEQDERILGYVHDRGRSAVILINKWDAVVKETESFDDAVKDLRERIKHHNDSPIISVSALKGKRVMNVPEAVVRVYENAHRRISTGELNRIFERALQKNPPPFRHNKRLKVYYVTQGGITPPTFIAFCNRPKDIHFSYERYLVNQLRAAADFSGSPVRLFFKGKKK